MESEGSKNFKAMLIGFVLIAGIIILMLYKFDREEKLSAQENILEVEKALDLTKSARSIDSAELLAKINQQEKIILLDIRTAEEFKKEHLLNSINIPQDIFEENISKLKKELTYVLIDNTNTLEVLNLVGATLPKSGVKNVYYLDGGFNKWKNSFYSTISEGDPNSLSDQAKVTYITSDKLKETLSQEKNLFIIDVRGQKSFNAEHIPNAINIYVDEIEKRIGEVPYGKKIIIYDDDTLLAFKAAVRLFDLGKINIFTLSDGFGKWKEKKYPTEKTQP